MTHRPAGYDEAMARLTAPGAPFEIHTEEVLGEPMQVFARRHRSLIELLEASADHGDREYLVSEAARYTYTEHLATVAALATALHDDYGVRKGDRVAICAANSPEWVLTFWAAISLGAVAVGMNSLWAAPELRHGLELTEPTVLVADAPRRKLAGELDIPVLTMEDDLPALIAKHAAASLPQVSVEEDDPAVILFTSGTTGRPKGATHSHRNTVAAVWFHLLNDAVATELGKPPKDRRYLLTTPLFHIAGLHNLVVIRLAVGDTAIVHTGRFDVDRVLRLIERERATNWAAVPTMLARVVDFADARGGLGGYDLGSLRTVSISSAPSSRHLKERTREVLPGAKQSLNTSYGCTESSTAATIASAPELLADPGTVGRPIPTAQVEIRGADGRRVPDGTEGEIHLRSPHVMLGYWNNPEATAASIVEGRWYRTGDLGTIVDGALRISSRRSDLILRGGENVYPAEVEDQLASHPSVLESIVVGAPHPEWGEEVAAIVVVRPGSTVTAEELRDHLAERLAKYKVPSRWQLTARELPRNATGKVNRAEVTLT